MIMLTVTKPRRKLKRLLKGGALLLLLGVVVPGIYYSLQTVGAMSLFVAEEEPAQLEQSAPAQPAEPPAQTKSEETLAGDLAENPAESSAENSEPDAKGGGLWAALQAVLFGDRGQVIPYEPGA